jgi:peptidoglycan-N-acetylglucosamine deacetylase
VRLKEGIVGNRWIFIIRKKIAEKKYLIRRTVVIILTLMVLFFTSFFVYGDIMKYKLLNNAKKSDPKHYNSIAQKQMDNKETKIPPSDQVIKQSSGSKPKIDENGVKDINASNGKVAYLTFDDGPSKVSTPKILDILVENNIKASFFVIGNMAESNKAMIIRENAEGNVVLNHTYSHDYKYIYSNTDNFIADFKKGEETIKSILGNDYMVKYIRFPGGSFGVARKPYREAATMAGYKYIDWNCLNGDAEGTDVPPIKLIENIKKSSAGKNHLVILMHDTDAKGTTVQALPEIIKYLRSQGFAFKSLD